MNTIFKHALQSYRSGGIDSVWTYLNYLIMTGEIEEETAEQIAYMVQEGE